MSSAVRMSDIESLLSKFSEQELKDWLLNFSDFAALNGVLKQNHDGAIMTLQHTFLPSPYPQVQFKEAVDIQRFFNSLFLSVASDYEFLESTFKPVLSQDEYVNNLWRIYQLDHELGPVQPLKLSLNRSDYMLHSAFPGCPLKQVEMNFIAVSFGGVAERLVKVHQMRLNQLLGANAPKLPACPSATKFGSAIARAVEEYVKSSAHLQRTSLPAILVVVSEDETNIYDQRSIEEAVLYANASLRLLRRTFAELAEPTGRVNVEEATERLFVDGYEIALIYYRTGYAPSHFDEEAWRTKLRLERSLAIKCPSIDYLLANMKLVQTALAAGPTVLSRFGVSPQTAERLAATFARQTVLSTDFHFADPAIIDQMVEECRRRPDKFVLKPQREGGGNNIFGADIVRKLDKVMGKLEANAYILMEKLEPPIVENCVVGIEYPSPLRRQMISELGIYGVLLSRGTDELENHEAGHLLRTKLLGINEGGVVTGFANLDTPLLLPPPL
ncbi:Glutathione synthetase [Echinococcus granulosus]|uniref:Glutathione synthetase n=1 Tax=Echinococcus granulosus TaxID=6210 RepID=A0A068WS71_ECHGR|nr:Glutathione synthetase [Echinococcus granulosus]CDS22995.1 glutathione synthetase [Echinococcus granulosus]